jgi:hypothetical protein
MFHNMTIEVTSFESGVGGRQSRNGVARCQRDFPTKKPGNGEVQLDIDGANSRILELTLWLARHFLAES